jgi:hypothetical protein
LVCIKVFFEDSHHPTHRFAGKGIHSPNHAAKLKPAIEELMLK